MTGTVERDWERGGRRGSWTMQVKVELTLRGVASEHWPACTPPAKGGRPARPPFTHRNFKHWLFLKVNMKQTHETK